MIVYFTIHHAALAMDYNLIDQIREKYIGRQILEPSLYYYSAYQGNIEDVKKVRESADAILAAQPDDWIALEMHFYKFEAAMRNYPKIIYDTSTVESIVDLIKSDSRLGFYEATLNDYMSRRAHTDGDIDERIRCIDRGILTAEKFDDRVRLCDFLIKKAQIVKDHNRTQARELLEQAYEMSDTIGIAADFAEIIDILGKLDAIQGEFDGAIRHSLKAVTIRERAGLNTGNTSLLLSTLFNVTGAYQSGYEWGCMAEVQFRSRPTLIPRAILNQAWSLILLGRLTEATVLIDTTRESILKSGDETHLAWLHFVTGILEMADGDLVSSASSIEEALRIYEAQGGAYMIQLIFLHHLAKSEVYSYDTTSIVSPSLAILEDKALTEDLPGILGQVLLLKADIAIINNDDASLRGIIQQLRPLTEKDSMQFLKPFFNSLLRRV
jgi:tetratricopeptide (TPR) repeat protein